MDMKLMGQLVTICRDAQGVERWRDCHMNQVVNAGLNYALSVALAGGSQISSWYLGLIASTGTERVLAGDTMASHGGWSELTSYDEAARQAWTPGAVASQQVTNSLSAAVFTFTSGSSFSGVFMASDATKGGTSGTLYAVSLLSAARAPEDGDTVEVSYNIIAGR